MPDQAYVRIFTKSRRGIATKLVRGLGQVKIKKGTTPTVTIKDETFEVMRTIVRRVDLPGSTFDLLIVGFKYAKQKMDVSPAPPTAMQAKLTITLTNQPVDDDPEDVVITGQDDEPIDEEGESPTMPDDDIILNT